MWKPAPKAPSLSRNLKHWAWGVLATLAMFSVVAMMASQQEAASNAPAPATPAQKAEAAKAAEVADAISESGDECWGGPVAMPADMEGQFPGAAIVDHQTKDGVKVEYVTDMALVGAALDFSMKDAPYPGLVEVYRFCRG